MDLFHGPRIAKFFIYDAERQANSIVHNNVHNKDNPFNSSQLKLSNDDGRELSNKHRQAFR